MQILEIQVDISVFTSYFLVVIVEMISVWFRTTYFVTFPGLIALS